MTPPLADNTTPLFSCQFFEVLDLMQHEYMGANWTHAEGFILGLGAKMFKIAGPVIVYGVSASVIYGLIYWLFSLK